MARGKAKKSQNKRQKPSTKKDEVEESGLHKNMGSFAGIAAVSVVILAILYRPQQGVANDGSTSPPANAQDNLTVEQKDWVPANPPSVEEKVVAEPPADPEPITQGFSIAAFHNVDDPIIHKEDLIHYLRYDDGYTACLTKSDLEYDEYGVWELKQAKLSYLETIASHKPHWIAQSPLAYDATCRILTLTHEDFEGYDKFMALMKENKTEDILKFTLEKQTDASEFRTIVCLSRLGDLMVDQVATPDYRELKQDWARVGMQAKEDTEAAKSSMIAYGWQAKPDKESRFHFYVNGPLQTWIRPTTRPGEKGTRPLGPKEKKASLIVRKNPCPVKDSMALVATEQEKEQEARQKVEKREAEIRKAQEEEAKRRAAAALKRDEPPKVKVMSSNGDPANIKVISSNGDSKNTAVKMEPVEESAKPVESVEEEHTQKPHKEFSLKNFFGRKDKK